MVIFESKFKSSNNKNEVDVKTYNLNNFAKAIIVILHGMSECKDIYSSLATFFADNKYAVITYDSIGHGNSVNTEDERGFFANNNGYEYLTKDLEYVINEAKKYNLPIFLFGHSMGSLISRNYVATSKTKEIAGLILSGTIGPQWAIDGAIQFADYMVNKKGPRYRSRMLNDLLTKVSSWKFEDMKNSLEWSTRDKEFIKEAQKDTRMNFIFTASGFKDVFSLVKFTGQKEEIESIPKDLPILMISGGDDILGEYSEGVKRLEEAYKQAGIEDVTVKIYDKSRHNLIQDLDKQKVFEDILDWIEIVRFSLDE